MVRKQKQGDKKQKIFKKDIKNKKEEEKNHERQKMIEMTSTNSFTQEQGQTQQNCAEKQRKAIRSSEPMILKNYSGAFFISFLQIIATLFNGVEPTEILEFINFEYGRFLEILSLMMTDDEMPVVSIDLNMINASCSLVNPQIPRSFSYGLKKLRELRGLTNLIQPLYLDHIDIRCLKIAYFLLIGVGQIDPNIKSRQKDQSQQLYFHRITTYLLKRNSFLTPKLFYLIRDKWQSIMAIIYDQLKQDREQRVLEQTEKPSYDRTPSILPPLSQAERQKLNNASQKSTAEKQQKQWKEKDQYPECHSQKEDLISIDFPEQQPLNQRLYDYDRKFFESDKKKDKETQSQKQQLIYDRTVERKKKQQGMSEEYEKETVNMNEEINQQKKEGQDYFGKSNAYQNFNYMKVKTIDRTKQNKLLKTKVIAKKGKKVETKTEQKKPSMGEQQKTYKSQPNWIKHQKNMESSDDFMFGDQEDIYGRGLQYPCQGLEEEIYISEDSKMEQDESKMVEILLSEDMQSSERRHMESELERMAVQSQNSSMLTFVENTNQQEQQSYVQQQPYQQQSQEQQFQRQSEQQQFQQSQEQEQHQQSQQEQQLHRQQQTRQSFRHENRQIDYLVERALANREQFVESMANQIYYELIVWNVRLRQAQQFQEERDSCCRKLFQK